MSMKYSESFNKLVKIQNELYGFRTKTDRAITNSITLTAVAMLEKLENEIETLKELIENNSKINEKR